MSEIDTILPGVLNYINEGIVIAKTDLSITYWNPYMEKLTGRKQQEVIGRKIQEVLPYLQRHFFEQSIQRLFSDGIPAFFSAAMHHQMIRSDLRVNLKMKRVGCCNQPAVLLEFIDVTNQFSRIAQLRDAIKQLSALNAKLKQKEKVIEKLAYYDQLTGVANRALFNKFAGKFLARAKELKQILALVFIDVNEFKSINDTYGHRTGDQVMAQVAGLLSESIGEDDIVCRYGGDEFIILLPNIGDYQGYLQLSEKLRRKVSQCVIQDGFEISLSISIGASFFPNDGSTLDELIAKADQFMYVNKNDFRTR